MGNCFHSTTVKATVDQVWAAVSNFHDFGWATGVIESCEKVGDVGGTQVGAKRLLNGAIQETLVSVDGDNHRFTYSIDNGPAPLNSDAITSYTGVVEFLPITSGGGTFIKWTSCYETADDSAVSEFCNPIYAALMDCLQKHFGT